MADSCARAGRDTAITSPCLSTAEHQIEPASPISELVDERAGASKISAWPGEYQEVTGGGSKRLTTPLQALLPPLVRSCTAAPARHRAEPGLTEPASESSGSRRPGGDQGEKRAGSTIPQRAFFEPRIRDGSARSRCRRRWRLGRIVESSRSRLPPGAQRELRSAAALSPRARRGCRCGRARPGSAGGAPEPARLRAIILSTNGIVSRSMTPKAATAMPTTESSMAR